jgi:hypothetical protein
MLNLSNLKQELKDLATFIKATKPEVRYQKVYDCSTEEGLSLQKAAWSLSSKLEKSRKEFRTKLIGYCELRGLKRDRIEKPAKDNQPDEAAIREIHRTYLAEWGIHA